MKVKSLFIKDYNQFKDFELDLTYPKGHKKEGQPLDKVCIIGQSGTGKTTLLRFVQAHTSIEIHTGAAKLYFKHLFPSKVAKYLNSGIEIVLKNSSYNLSANNIPKTQGVDYTIQPNDTDSFDFFLKSLFEIKTKNVFIEAKQKANFSDFESNTSIDLEKYKYNYWSEFAEVEPQHFMFFWSPLKYEIEEFKKNLINRRNEFAKMVTQRQISSADVDNERKILRDWEETQENPLKKLEFLNTILNNFKQKVKTDIDAVEEIEFIKLETLNGITLKGDILSTGTQQILLTALPLYSLKPENSIILFDEPESSLYPDIQTQIIEFYTNLAKDCQFFFATHSPLIASSFEPWEIVELRFNDEGNVYREKYYEDENHIDNYKFYPEYLRYDTILSKVFDLPNEANPKRRKILDEIAILEKQLKNGVSQEEKTVLWEKYQALQKKVNWEEDDEKY